MEPAVSGATAIQALFRGFQCRREVRRAWGRWLDMVRSIERNPVLNFGHHLPLLIDPGDSVGTVSSNSSVTTSTGMRVVHSHGSSPYAYSVQRPGIASPGTIVGPSLGHEGAPANAESGSPRRIQTAKGCASPRHSPAPPPDFNTAMSLLQDAPVQITFGATV